MLGPALYDKGPTGAIPKPGKDAIVSEIRLNFLGLSEFELSGTPQVVIDFFAGLLGPLGTFLRIGEAGNKALNEVEAFIKDGTDPQVQEMVSILRSRPDILGRCGLTPADFEQILSSSDSLDQDFRACLARQYHASPAAPQSFATKAAQEGTKFGIKQALAPATDAVGTLLSNRLDLSPFGQLIIQRTVGAGTGILVNRIFDAISGQEFLLIGEAQNNEAMTLPARKQDLLFATGDAARTIVVRAPVESAGTTAINFVPGATEAFSNIVLPGPQPGPNVGDVARIPMLRSPQALALMSNGNQALVSDGGDLLRLDLTTQGAQIVATGLQGLGRIVIEAQGASALVLQRGEPRFSGDPVGQLLRINVTTGAKTLLATGFIDPRGIAIEVEGQSALVRDGSAIYRVNLQTGNIAMLAAGFGSGGIAVEPRGTSAIFPLVATFEIKRMNLLTNEISTVPSQLAGSLRSDAVIVSPDGSFALVAADGGEAGIAKVDLRTGETTQIFASGLSSFCSSGMLDIALTKDASEAIFMWFTPGDPQVSRIRLADKILSNVTYSITPFSIALEGDGSTALITSIGFCFGSLYRMDIATGAPDLISGVGTTFGGGLGGDVVISSDGREALVTGTRFFVSTGDLFRINSPLAL
jgi:sugar lactone lactonase YvrE